MPLNVRTFGLMLIMCASNVVCQPVAGCPSYGCTPTGSFSLLTSNGIPRSGVKVIWTTQLSNSSGTGTPLLGCVSNNKHLVCPTPQGYLGLDGDTGKVLWRDTTLVNPTLPIMDVMGDVIGSDGKYLTKVDVDGTVIKPLISLDPPMIPIYSVEFGDENILLLTSQTGELVAYLTNGIPLANLFLRGNVETYNGTFHPIAQPVMNGSRAYVLTQFKPDPQYTDIPREKVDMTRWKRLFAIDIRASESERMRIIWNVSCATNTFVRCFNNSRRPADQTYEHVLLSYGGVIYISLTGQHEQQHCVYESKPVFLAVSDMGDHGDILYQQTRTPSYLSVYDDVFSRCGDVTAASLLWVAEQGGRVITGLDPQTGTTLSVFRLHEILNVTHVVVTSRLMVKGSDPDYILLFGSKQSRHGSAANPYITALEVSTINKFSTRTVWNVGLKNDLKTEGQMSLISGISDVIVTVGYNRSGIYAVGIK